MSTLLRPFSSLAGLGAVALVVLAACGDDEPGSQDESLSSGPAEVEVAGRADAPAEGAPVEAGSSAAVLRNPSGAEVGTAEFETFPDGSTHVSVDVAAGGEPNTFHGIHVHANDDPANGDGCVADAGAPPDTWFVSADGHFAAEGTVHGHHRGDMPGILVTGDGTGSLRFVTDRFAAADVEGRALILHSGTDNFGHVPVGEGVDQYMPNSPDATDLTARTGNAGDRIACGVIEPSGPAPGDDAGADGDAAP